MRKNKFALLLITIAFFKCFAQQNVVEIKYSIKNEKSFVYKEKTIDDEIIEGYAPIDTLFFKNNTSFKLYFVTTIRKF
ncbi:hypothetical protein HNQ02_003711 [Flavobacterium sp. 7E]|uniref:hypothetical protein n=1 Tax=Flavobacterium sp. 7E TaxID=2735898 RepID=UPI0015700D12|nr:hypothetical protein [Flavobacterium sp. 7E]NRS90764.1 hypothetical protein [Flavobacterium sp. 7E]